MRTIYHTQVKHMAREGLLSSGILRLIPRSNIYRWKSEQPGRYQTFGINLSEDFELVKSFAEDKNAKRVFSAYVRIIHTAMTIAHHLPGFHRAIKQSARQVVEVITRARPYIGLQRTLRFFNISVPTFRQWSLQSFTECFHSITGGCNRIFPNQLSKPQVLKLRELLTDPGFQFWPVSSIAWYALRNNILALSLNTWYKYVHKLGIKRPVPLSRRKKTSIGIRATRPHQIWHADISVFVTADQIKHYIYCVVDNYSRKILSCTAHDSVKAEFRRITLLEATMNTKELNLPVTLITDSGPENNLDFSQVPVLFDHLKAMVDIHYSNSMIEAHNKILKYNYLYRMDVKDGGQLKSILPKIVEDFNNRPHISLCGLTPNEAEQNITLDPDAISKNIQQAVLERKLYNQLHQCGHC